MFFSRKDLFVVILHKTTVFFYIYYKYFDAILSENVSFHLIKWNTNLDMKKSFTQIKVRISKIIFTLGIGSLDRDIASSLLAVAW